MPKILEDIREKAVLYTRQVLTQQGYDALTVRAVAKSCGVAVGTMYNYFPSKEYLTGCVVLEDWLSAYEEMARCAANAQSLESGLEQIYGLMGQFVEAHQYLTAFDQRKAGEQYSYHKMHLRLRQQIEVLLQSLLHQVGGAAAPEVLAFVAESFLNCSVKKYEYPQIAAAFTKLLS